MRVGYIGLGNMGEGMATNLLKYATEHEIAFRVFDVDSAALNKMSEKGAQVSSSISDLAQNSDVVFTSLPSSKEVAIVALGPDGLLENLPKNATWFETSTSDVSSWQSVRTIAPDHLMLIDAPVTGGSEGASAGTLTMLLGLDTPLSDPLNKLLKSFTGRVVPMGPSGAGYIAKLSQLHLNYLVAQGIGEAMMLGAKGNLDLSTLYDVLCNSCAQSYVVENYIPKILDSSYDPSFTLGLAEKDMQLVSQLGNHLNIEMPLGNLVCDSYQQALDSYGHDAPHLNIVKLIEAKTNINLRK